MNTTFSIKRILLLLLLLGSLYYWVLLPIINVVLYVREGRDVAENCYLSLFILTPVSILFTQEEQIPNHPFQIILYYLIQAGDFIAFAITIGVVVALNKRLKQLERVFIYSGIAFTFAAIIALLQENYLRGLLALLATLSAVVLGVAFTNARHPSANT